MSEETKRVSVTTLPNAVFSLLTTGGLGVALGVGVVLYQGGGVVGWAILALAGMVFHAGLVGVAMFAVQSD